MIISIALSMHVVLFKSVDVDSFFPSESDHALHSNKVMKMLNYYRGMAGLSPAIMIKKLNLAAVRHAAYLAVNGVGQSSHEETEGLPGFYGKMPWDRAKAADVNFQGISGEGIARGVKFPTNGFEQLFHEPVHRTNFILSDETYIGLGFLNFNNIGKAKEASIVMMQQCGVQKDLVLWPPRDCMNVPLSFDTGSAVFLRSRFGKKAAVVGYIPSITRSKPYLDCTEGGIELENGQKIESDLYISGEGAERFHLFIIPEKPYPPSSKVTAWAKLRETNNTKTEYRWTFTTGTASSDFSVLARSLK